jgi:hypothetical protein
MFIDTAIMAVLVVKSTKVGMPKKPIRCGIRR